MRFTEDEEREYAALSRAFGWPTAETEETPKAEPLRTVWLAPGEHERLRSFAGNVAERRAAAASGLTAEEESQYQSWVRSMDPVA